MAMKANITIDQGTSFATSIAMADAANNPLDLTAYTGYAQIRKWYSSVAHTNFNVALVLGAVNLSLTPDQTNVLAPGRYVYDLVLVDHANAVTRVIEGVVTVTPKVTTLSDYSTP